MDVTDHEVIHLCNRRIGRHEPQVNIVVCECVNGRIEICAYLDEDVADLRFGRLADTPLSYGLLQLLCRDEQIAHGSWYIAGDPLCRHRRGLILLYCGR